MKQLVGVLLLVGFVMAYWLWVLAVVVLVLVSRAAPAARRDARAEQDQRRARAAALVARADQQHRWASEGDSRGTFGNYPPASL